MLLGVYWYYGFPTGLYSYDLFAFQPGLGGHADGPAELTATVRVVNPDALLHELQGLAQRYPDVHFFVEHASDVLRVTVGGYYLSDYAFFLAGQAEAVLRQAGAVPAPTLPAGATFQRLSSPRQEANTLDRDRLLQVVASRAKKYHAETLALRLDCHLPLPRKTGFLAALDALCTQHELDVLYYLDREVGANVNLMLFFTNGRQGVGGRPQRYTDGPAVDDAVRQALAAHGGQPKHLGRYPEEYPQRGPHVVRIVDADFVL